MSRSIETRVRRNAYRRHATIRCAAHVAMRPGRGHFPSIRTMVEVDVRDWLHIVGVTLDEDLIETILRESETALRPFLTIEKQGVGFDSPAVLATAVR